LRPAGVGIVKAIAESVRLGKELEGGMVWPTM
jgi:hypothetical protein